MHWGYLHQHGFWHFLTWVLVRAECVDLVRDEVKVVLLAKARIVQDYLLAV